MRIRFFQGANGPADQEELFFRHLTHDAGEQELQIPFDDR